MDKRDDRQYEEKAGRGIGRLCAAVGVAGISMGMILATPLSADAAFPGANGVIAFVSERNGGTPLIFTVNPATANGTESGDTAAVQQLTQQDTGTDAEPFFTPDGQTVLFSSDVNGNWQIFKITADSTPSPDSDDRQLVSQTPTDTSDNDYAPSISPNGDTVVFNRDGSSLWTVSLSGGPSTAQLLITPAVGLQNPVTDGLASRPVFDPVDPSKLLFVGNNSHIYLITGVGTPGFNSNQTPIDLSAATGITTTAADENPDWSPDGSTIVFDSTRGGTSQLYTLNPNATPADPIPAQPVFSAPTGKSDTEPVFSPDGTKIAWVRPMQSADVFEQMVTDVNSENQAVPGTAEDLTVDTTGAPQDNQPDWQPLPPRAQTPEAPLTTLLPLSAGVMLLGTSALIRRRRRPGQVSGPGA